MRTATLVVVLTVAAACDRGRHSPFATTATPELRAAVAKACAAPGGKSSEGDIYGWAYSDGRCHLRLVFESDTFEIKYLMFSTGESFEREEQILREIVLPTLRADAQQAVEARVLKVLRDAAYVSAPLPGGWSLYYYNHPHDRLDDDLNMIARPNMTLSISRN